MYGDCKGVCECGRHWEFLERVLLVRYRYAIFRSRVLTRIARLKSSRIESLKRRGRIERF